jgi:heptose-I-phosphate ethanolaminephosphotransferase
LWASFSGCTNILKWRSLRMAIFSSLLFWGIGVSIENSLHGKYLIELSMLLFLWTLPYISVRGHSVAQQDKDLSRIKGTYFVGTACAALSIILQSNLIPQGWWIQAMLALMFIYAGFSALAYLVYYLLFHNIFQAGDMVPVLSTRFSEAKGFLIGQVGCKRLTFLSFALSGVVILVIAYFSAVKLSALTIANVYGAIAFCGAALLLLICYLRQSFPVHEYLEALRQIKNMKAAVNIHRKNLANLEMNVSQNKPGTTILVIGESANRDHMNCFNPSYDIDTTPWESKMLENENFFFFKNSYSNFTQTTEALALALTGMNQYNHRSSRDLISIIDVAKAAGMETWWISNHSRGGTGYIGESIIQSVDHCIYVDNTQGDDSQVLQFLTKISGNGNRLIVIHLMGSHLRYEDRTPDTFKFSGKEKNEKIFAYDKSIAYTDFILHQIYQIGTQKLHAELIIYVSDHGEDMKYTHGLGHFTYDMVRIPMWIYLSREYQERFTDVSQSLKNHENDVFTNDLLFDVLCGIMHTPNSSYTEHYDLSSSLYDLTSDAAVTLHGREKIKKDCKW